MTTTSARIAPRVATGGAPLTRAKAAMILLHGRGADAPRQFNGLAFPVPNPVPHCDLLCSCGIPRWFLTTQLH